MHAIYAFGLLVLIAFLGSQFFFKKKKFLSPLTFFFLSGLIYIFLGLYLGEDGINVLSSEVLKGLSPLISLGLGWIGFLFGFQLELKYLRRFPRKYLGLSWIQFVSVFLAAASILFLAVKELYFSQPSFLLYGMAVALGILASLNSPTLLNAVSAALPARGDYYYLARFLVSVCGFWGITGLALLSSFWHYPFFDSNIVPKGLLVFFVSTIFPVVMGTVFHHLTKKRISDEDLLVYILGLIFFVSGTAFYFNQPPLYVCMVLGIVFSNLTKKQEKLYPLLFSTEKPLYIIFLILIGALWDFQWDFRVAALVVLLLSVKVLSYTLPLPLFKRILGFPFALPVDFGLCFLSSGGIGIAYAVSLKLVYPMPLTDVFLSVALLMVIVSELLSPLALRFSLTRLESEEHA